MYGRWRTFVLPVSIVSSLVVPVLAKLPLGLFVPRFARDLPEGFPYDPYWRDVSIASLSMLCRGEFNFIVASFGLSSGLLDPNQYAEVVFAVLLSCVCAPLALTQVIRYYNGKSKAYLEANHPITRIGNTCDGYRPLFWAIQGRTPVHWGLQEKFKEHLEKKAGIIIIDHRSWHTLGLDAVDITEIFCQDTRVQVNVKSCFVDSIQSTTMDRGDNESLNESSHRTPTTTSASEIGVGDEKDKVQKRCEEIRRGMFNRYCLVFTSLPFLVFPSLLLCSLNSARRVSW
jgi:hypothetical protein